ncbi:ribonuclease H [Ancylomarina salipaludis]|uniref:Ribonuclease H n=1 Tax=Ancylomarina salipaludis TaxID=2501299 RepID=A0A4Q1JJU4_9BACT|nr:ribonuclease H family protein [Ancylomarina salipaludis]RXQ89499.1 ribonuclease H [Ancylomarina salipaludis]
MAKQKYYVVWKGRKTGIFDNWTECNKHVSGFKDAEYKSFKDLELAQKAYSENYKKYKGKDTTTTKPIQEQIDNAGKPNLDTISVDAACSGNPGIMEYQAVDTKTKKLIFHGGPYYDSTNNIGEFIALVHCLAHMKKNGDTRPIYTDSKTAMSWVRDKIVRTDNPKTENNKKSFDTIERALNWLKNNEYPNKILKWETKVWGEIPADFGRK